MSEVILHQHGRRVYTPTEADVPDQGCRDLLSLLQLPSRVFGRNVTKLMKITTQVG